MRLRDVRLVVVTGGGSGIGRATAERFARGGATVVIADIDLAAAEVTAAGIARNGGIAHARRLDVTDVEAFEAFAAQVQAEHGVCDVMVNNAGAGSFGEVVTTTETEWDRIVGINLLGVVHGTRLFAQHMVDAGKRGHVVNVASAAAFVALPNLASYSMTKCAVKMLGDCVRAELTPQGIGVSTICPGVIKTNLFATATHSAQTEEEASDRSAVVDAATDVLRNLRIIAGPDLVARRIELAVRLDLGTVLVRPEAFGVYLLRRASPSLLRVLANVGFGAPTIGLAFRASRAPRVRRLLGVRR